METKHCSRHNNGQGADLPVSAFGKETRKASKALYRSACRECEVEAARKYRAENRQKVRDSNARYRANHPEKCKRIYRAWIKEDRKRHPEKHRRRAMDVHLRKKFGINVRQFEELLAKQGGVCALCRQPSADPDGDRLAVDHCHKSSKVRGLLCFRCNTAIERFDAIPDWGERVSVYLGNGTNATLYNPGA